MKKCSGCDQSLPLTSFYASGVNPDGLQYFCKQCARLKAREWSAKKRNAQLEQVRVCADCQSNFFLDTLHKSRNNGLCLQCHTKRVATSKIARQPHTNMMRRRQMAKRLSDGACMTCRTARLPHSNLYCENHWFREMSVRHLGVVKYGEELKLLAERQKYACPYTGVQLVPGLNMSLDHKLPVSRFPEKQRDVSNVWWVTWDVNRMKSDMTHDEFVVFCHEVASRFSNPVVTTPGLLLSGRAAQLVNG